MRIGTIGAGLMAEALGTGWARAGHELVVGSRTPTKAAALAGRIGSRARAGTRRDAATFGDVILLAVHHHDVATALTDVGAHDGALAGRVIVDCTNVVEHGTGRLVAPGEASMAELISALATGARVVKAFNLCPSHVWSSPPPVDGGPLVVPICGGDDQALDTVGELVTDLGCRPVTTGGLERAGQLEAVAGFVIGLAFAGVDPRSTIALVPAEHATN